jgi:hypothetical protein
MVIFLTLFKSHIAIVVSRQAFIWTAARPFFPGE